MKYIIIILTFLSVFVKSQKGNLNIEYEFSYVNDSLNSSNIKSESMILKIFKNDFVFLSKSDYIKDTIQGNINDLSKYMINGRLNVNEIRPEFGGKTDNKIRLYYNSLSHNYFIQTNVALTKIDFEDEVPNINWEIHDESKIIFGYKAKKATAKIFDREWEAWYTEEIPISFGPYKFNGLPGLIIEINDNQNFFKYNFKKISHDNLPLPNKLDYMRLQMSKKEFKDYIVKYKENPLIVLGDNPSVLKNDEEFINRKKAKLKLNNNSIERGIQFNLK